MIFFYAANAISESCRLWLWRTTTTPRGYAWLAGWHWAWKCCGPPIWVMGKRSRKCSRWVMSSGYHGITQSKWPCWCSDSSLPSEKWAPGGTHADHPSTRTWGSVGSWGWDVTIWSHLQLLQLQVLAAAGSGGCCDGLMQQDQSVSLHLKENDRSDKHMPFGSGQN